MCFLHYLTIQKVQVWIGNNILEPLQWGWKLSDDLLLPITTELLKVIKCSCAGSCESNRCTCRKNQIPCSIAFKNCKGLNCANSPEIDKNDDDMV